MNRIRRRWLAVAGGALIAATVAIAGPAIAGQSTGTVSGHLLDGGAATPDIPVALWDMYFNTVATTSTDATGAYTFPDVPAGDYKVGFTFPGNLFEYAYQKFDIYTADPVTVSAGAVATVDENVAPHGGLSGHVTASDGTAAAGVQLFAQSTTNYNINIYATTDANGDYALPFVPVSSYVIGLTDPTTGLTQYAHQKTLRNQATPIAVAAGATTTVDETLLLAGTISGHLTDAGQPISGAYVNASDTAGQGSGGYAITEADGAYRMAVFAGTYTVGFSLPNGLTQYAHQRDSATAADPITVTAGGTTVVDEQALPTGTISGHLLDTAGNPVQGSTVDIEGSSQPYVALTDSTGFFQAVLFPGQYRVHFIGSGAQQWAFGKTSGATADPITVTAGTTTTVDDQLLAPGSVSVTVRDAVTHTPVSTFCAGLDNVWDYPCTQDGTAIFTTVQPGSYGLSVDAAGYLSARVNRVQVTSGQTTSIVVDVIRGATLTTTVKDARTGTPLRGICLELVERTHPSTLGMHAESYCSDPTGAVTVDQVTPGTYNVFAWASDGVHGSQWVGQNGGVGAQSEARLVTLSAGSTSTLPAVKVDPKGMISGTILDAATHQPISQAIVAASSYNAVYGGVHGLVATDSTGKYTMDNLGPYEWVLYFHANGYASKFSGNTGNRLNASTVTVRAGRTTTYNTNLGRGLLLTGTILSPTGQPVSAGLTLVNANSGDETELGSADASGTYAMRVLGGQRVKLRIEGGQYGEFSVYWYASAVDFSTATVVSIPVSGTTTVNITFAPPS